MEQLLECEISPRSSGQREREREKENSTRARCFSFPAHLGLRDNFARIYARITHIEAQIEIERGETREWEKSGAAI